MINVKKLEDESYTNPVMEMYEKLNVQLVKEILKKITEKSDISSFTKHQLRVLKHRGGAELFRKAIKETNKLSSKRKKELNKMFTEVIREDLSQYRNEYEAVGKDFELSKQQILIINKMLKLTDKELKNFTRTIAFSTQEEFVNAVDEMYKQLVDGGLDFDSAYKKTTKDLNRKGIQLKMKNGKNRSIESAVRQNVLYGIRRTSQLINDDLIDYLDADAVQINISPNCRHSHKIINGKIFALRKGNKYPFFKQEYRDLMDEYGCQHYASPFIIGVSEPIYTNKEINEADNRVVKYKGKEMPYYDATQKQRALEREIRSAKKAYAITQSKENKMKLKEAQDNIKKFTKETGLLRDKSREFFAGK